MLSFPSLYSVEWIIIQGAKFSISWTETQHSKINVLHHSMDSQKEVKYAEFLGKL
jgi:hypothetical protein